MFIWLKIFLISILISIISIYGKGKTKKNCFSYQFKLFLILEYFAVILGLISFIVLIWFF